MTAAHKLDSNQKSISLSRSDRRVECKSHEEPTGESFAKIHSNTSTNNAMEQESENRSTKRQCSCCESEEVDKKPHKQARNSRPPCYYQPKETSDLKTSFRIRKHLGEGAFGSVFLTIDQKSNEPKVIKRVKTRDDKSVATYGFPYTALREIKILHTIKHKNVINLHEVVTTTGSDGLPEHVFLVFEYMQFDLAALLGLPELARKLTDAHVRTWTHQLLLACDYLHGQHIVHRDIKPANILIDTEGTLKIGDFGLARHLCQENRRFTTSVGTPWYRAPEMLLGSSTYDTNVDMWSLGCVLFELACRYQPTRPLFHAATKLDLCKQIDLKCSLMSNGSWLVKEIANAHNRQVLENTVLLAELIMNLLKLDTNYRLSAKGALETGFLANFDGNHKVDMTLPRSSCHELDVLKLKHCKNN